MDDDQQSPESPSPRYTGRHRPALLARTVFAALTTATLIGAGITAASAAGPSDAGTGAPAAAERQDASRADRADANRAEPREPSSPSKVPDKPEPNKPKTKPKPKPSWVLPSPEDISDVFGPRGWRGGEMHAGTDFAAAEGEDNHAAAAGVVVQAGPNGGYGNSVTIDHGNGVETLYGHNSQVLVAVGDRVKPGDVIGKAGHTGDVTGPHLHFEVHIDGQATDPEKFLRDKHVKLPPHDSTK